MTNPKERHANGYRYVFICGLHRSGTSVLGRNVARLEACTGFKDTGVIEDEGQFLQDVYPTAMTYGGVGRFGFDPRAHLTETSTLATPANAARLWASWHSYWDSSKTIFVEKTPGNLLKTRFLQALFPNSYFIVIRRHPVAVSMATQKWKPNFTSLHRLFAHWLHCHEVFEHDKRHLKHLYELSYEDYIADPSKYHREIAAFLDTSAPEIGMEELTHAHNQGYFNRWLELLTHSQLRRYYQYIAVKYDRKFAEYGYSLMEGFDINEKHIQRAQKMPAAVGWFYCLVADVLALLVRLATRSKRYVKKQARAWLPQLLKVRIKRVVQRRFLSRKHADSVSP